MVRNEGVGEMVEVGSISERKRLAWDQAFGADTGIRVEEEDLANNPEEWDVGREEKPGAFGIAESRRMLSNRNGQTVECMKSGGLNGLLTCPSSEIEVHSSRSGYA